MSIVHRTSDIEVRRNVTEVVDGVPSIESVVVAKGKSRVDLLHRHDPGDVVMIREAGVKPDRVGTVFLSPEMKVNAGDTIVVVRGQYAGVTLSVEVQPIEAFLGRGVVHKEAIVREVNKIVAKNF